MQSDPKVLITLARIDERTRATDERIRLHFEHDDQAHKLYDKIHADHEMRLRTAESFRNRMFGYGSALGLMAGAVAAWFTKLFSGVS